MKVLKVVAGHSERNSVFLDYVADASTDATLRAAADDLGEMMM